MIRLAIVGAGHWGPNLIRVFSEIDQSEVVWVVDRDPARLREVQSRYYGVRVSTDLAEALADSRVDACVIATPAASHYRLARLALEAKKDVLVEKPIATTVADAERLAALAERSKRVAMVGHLFLFNGGVRYVKEYIEGGRLGSLHYIAMVRTNLGPIRSDVNAAFDLAAHDIAIANYWIGALPTAVSAVGGAWINRGIEDTAILNLRYPRNILTNIHVSWLHPRKVRTATVTGERRMLTFDDMDSAEPVRVHDKHVASRKVPGFADSLEAFRASILQGNVTIPSIPWSEPLKAQCRHFVECVASRKRPFCDARQGLEVVRCLEAARRSMRAGGREVTLRTA